MKNGSAIAQAALVYFGAVVGFTIISFLVGPTSSRIGGTRAPETILPHLAELAGIGLLLGLVLLAISGRKGVPFAFLIPCLVLLLDLDHLPAYLGQAQVIRPAHSITFFLLIAVIIFVTFRRTDLCFAVLSASLGHMAVDTGIFAPFSPLSFSYIELDPYRMIFLVGSLVSALATGFSLRGGFHLHSGIPFQLGRRKVTALRS